MQNKNLEKIILGLRTLFFAIFVFAEFFGFGVLPKALAACNYQITTFDTNVSSFSSQDTVTFSGTVQRSESFASSSDNATCAASGFSVWITSTDIRNVTGALNVDVVMNSSASSFPSGGYTFSKDINFQQYQSSSFQNKTSAKFTLNVSGSNLGSKPTADLSLPITVTGSTPSQPPSGVASLTVNIDSAGVSVLGKGDSFDIKVTMQPSDVRKLQSRITKLRMDTYVNGNKIGSYEVNRSYLESNSPTQYSGDIETPIYKEGQNSIKVDMVDPGSQQIVATGNAQVAVKGLSGPVPDSGGGAGGPVPDSGSGSSGSGASSNNNSSTVDCKANPDKCLYNPLPTDELTTIFLWIARGFLGIVAIWSVIFIIVGGFRMVMSQGNEEAYTTAKKTVTWAILGLLIALLSFSIVAIVTNLIGANIQRTTLTKPDQQQN